MIARTQILAAIAVASFALAGCYQFPPPEVVKQANPSPLVGAKSFVVAPVTFRGFTYAGKSESEWLATRSAKQVASWENDKVTINQKLMKRLDQEKQAEQTFSFDGTPTDKQFLIAINFDSYDGQMRWTAEIRNASGEVVDIVRDPHAVTASFNTWMAEESGAQLAALMVSKYLHTRAFPE